MKLIQYSALVSLLASWAVQGALSASNEYPGCCGKKGTSDCASSTRKTVATLGTPVPGTADITDITGTSPGTGNDVDDPTNGLTAHGKRIENGLAAHGNALGKGIENGLADLGKGHENGLTAVGNGLAAHGKGIG
jgi:hypothetical protein